MFGAFGDDVGVGRGFGVLGGDVVARGEELGGMGGGEAMVSGDVAEEADVLGLGCGEVKEVPLGEVVFCGGGGGVVEEEGAATGGFDVFLALGGWCWALARRHGGVEDENVGEDECEE